MWEALRGCYTFEARLEKKCKAQWQFVSTVSRVLFGIYSVMLNIASSPLLSFCSLPLLWCFSPPVCVKPQICPCLYFWLSLNTGTLFSGSQPVTWQSGSNHFLVGSVDPLTLKHTEHKQQAKGMISYWFSHTHTAFSPTPFSSIREHVGNVLY